MSNPFEEENNPFADPSVQSAASHDYNAFDSDSLPNYSQPTSAVVVSRSAANSSATNNDKKKTTNTNTNENRGKYAPAPIDEDSDWNQDASSSSDMSVREAALKRREAQLEERIKQLEARERLAREQGMQPYNWPFKCYAVTYHSISEEIPLQHQALIGKYYIIVLFTWLALFWNWITVLARWFTKDADGSSSQVMWASIYLLLGAPGAWQLWYRSIYFGARDNANSKWIFFFVNFILHCLFCLVMCIGAPDTASAGVMMMIDLFINSHPINGFFALVATIMWIVDSGVSLVMLKKTHTIWRAMGGEERSKQEAATALAQQV